MVRHLRLHDAPANGLTRSILRGSTWTAVSYGLYQRTELTGHEIQRLHALREVLPPGAAWSHFTAARCWGLWLPCLPASLPLMATIQPKHIRPERSGLYVARSRARLPPPAVLDGLPVLSVPRVLGQLAEDLSLLDLVVAIDCALHQRLCSESDIFDAVVSRQRGIRMLRAAMALVDGRSESGWETILRLFHVLCGFQVVPQYKVRDETGQIVARADLWLPGTNRLAEYDGAHHREAAQHRADLRRDKVVSRLGKERYGYTADEIVQRPTRIMRDAEEAYGMEHDPRRLTVWLDELRRSSLSPEGRRRLLHRLHRFDHCRELREGG